MRLAFARPGGGISVAERQDDGAWAVSELTDEGVWPTPNARGTLVAASVVDIRERGDARSSVVLTDVGRGQEAAVAFRALPDAPPVIAPRVPHYVSWSPTGELLAIVAPGREALTLYLSAADGSISSDALLSGAPLFPAWSADGRHLAVHAGSDLFLVDVASRARTTVSDRAAGFRTPAFVGDELLYAVPGEPGVVLVARDLDTGQDRDVRRFDGGVALQARPHSRELSVAVTTEPDSGVFDAVWLGAPESPRSFRKVLRGPLAAVTWSPSGTLALVVAPAHTGDSRYQLQTFSAEGAFHAATEPIVPGADFRTMFGFFDQYGPSHPFWSDDGQWIAISGRLGGDGRSAALSDGVADQVFAWRVAPRSPLELVGEGDTLCFVPFRP